METPKTFNGWADYWRYTIGVNVIPADTRNKTTSISWGQYQDSAIPSEQHEQWKTEDAFRNGMAVIAGKVWHNHAKKELYLAFVDLDNLRAIDEFAVNGLKRLAQHVIVEQHDDDRSKAHIYFYTTKPLPKKSSDKVDPKLTQKLLNDEIPAIEVKGLGKHGIAYCTPSLHKNNRPCEILGTLEPSIVDDFRGHIDAICMKYNIPYLEATNGTDKALTPIAEMFKKDFEVLEGHNRHEALLRIMESLLARNMAILDIDSIKRIAAEWNQAHCKPPLPDADFEEQWHDATAFINKNPPVMPNIQRNETIEGDKQDKKQPAADILYELARARITSVIKDILTGEMYAVCIIDNRKQIVNMETLEFSSFLRRIYEQDYQQDPEKHERVISDRSLKNTIAQLMSRVDKEQYLGNRVIWDTATNTYYYNVGDKEGNVIKVRPDANGQAWEIVNNSDLLLFRNLGEKKAQIIPSKDYDINTRYLQHIMKNSKFKHEHHKIIDEVYAISLFLPGISQPVYLPNGGEGSGKSTLQIIKKSLADPYELKDVHTYGDRVSISLSDLETDDRKAWDRALVIESNWVTYFDNVSQIKTKIMDEFCRWCTPGFHKGKEKKYYNKELSEIGGKRPVGLNGIINPISNPDLLSRIFAPTLEQRNKDDDDTESFLQQFFEQKPIILGYIFGIISKFLYHYDTMRKIIHEKHRLKEFVIPAEIISRCLGNKEGALQAAWAENAIDQRDIAIEHSALAKTVIIYVDQNEKGKIEEQPEVLYNQLKNIGRLQGYDVDNDPTFPRGSNVLTKALNKLDVTLAKMGYKVTTGEKNAFGQRVIVIEKQLEQPAKPTPRTA